MRILNYISLKNPEILPIAFGLLMATSSCQNNEEYPTRPNFIIIQLDDLGYCDLGIHGNSIVETPVIDSFAGKSIQFTNFYVHPVCAPSRASLLTGRHFLKTGVSHVHGGKDHLHLEEKTFADIFKRAGYTTGMWGKWHSGTAEGYLPWQRGFEEAYMARLYVHRNSIGVLNGEPAETHKWADEAICDYALDFISRNRDNPFLAYLSFLTVHSPLDAPEEIIENYRAKGLSDQLASLYAMITYLDGQLNRFFSSLEEMDLFENTVIIFLSDNGPAIENGRLTDEDRKIRYVNNLRGHKGNIWDNGVKSPLFFYWKGKFESKKIDRLADITDLLPTIMELAGIDSTEGDLPIDGQSLVPLLKGQCYTASKFTYDYSNSGWPPSDLQWTPEGVKDEYRPVTEGLLEKMDPSIQIISIRNDRYKLLQNAANCPGSPAPVNSFVLVDIQNDPGERINIIENEPEIFNDLKNKLQNWFQEIKSSPHAFSMPVFPIHRGKDITIYAYAPFEISEELKNAFNYLGNWHVGSVAKYHIRLKEEVDMNFHVQFMGEIPENTTFEIKTNDCEPVIYSTHNPAKTVIRLTNDCKYLQVTCIASNSPGFAISNFRLSNN